MIAWYPLSVQALRRVRYRMTEISFGWLNVLWIMTQAIGAIFQRFVSICCADMVLGIYLHPLWTLQSSLFTILYIKWIGNGDQFVVTSQYLHSVTGKVNKVKKTFPKCRHFLTHIMCVRLHHCIFRRRESSFCSIGKQWNRKWVPITDVYMPHIRGPHSDDTHVTVVLGLWIMKGIAWIKSKPNSLM